MSWTNSAILLRTRMLGAMLGVDATRVLNIIDAPGQLSTDAAALGVALSRSVAAMKRAAMDEAGGRVDYLRLANSNAYIIYRDCVASVLPSVDLTTFRTPGQKLAFWVNLYNALVLDATIQSERGVDTGSWPASDIGRLRFFQSAAYNVGGMRLSCEDIEHGVLRANAGNPFIPGPHWGASDPRVAFMVTRPDPRVHFALNCAARSCPPIAAYEAARVEDQLEMAARNFVAQEVIVDRSRGEIALSSIFRWYEGDFGGRAPMLAFVARRLPDVADSRWLDETGSAAKLVYRPYDWGLNRWT